MNCMNIRKSVLGMITLILTLIVMLGMGIDSVINSKKAIFNNLHSENTNKVLQFEYNYHIQPGSLPY